MVDGMMRVRWFGWMALTLGLTAAAGAQGADREPRLDARRLAAMVQAFYDQTKTVEADFYQTYYHRLYDRYDRSKGHVVFKKPGRMRWEYARPSGKVIVSDGRKLRVFDPGEEGEQPQLVEHDVQGRQLPAAFSFLTGQGRILDDFRVRLLDPRRQGFPSGYVLELRPKEPTPHYDRVLFYVTVVGRDGRQAAVVRRVLIVDAEGNRNRFDFSRLRFNREVPDERFEFRPPPGTRIVHP